MMITLFVTEKKQGHSALLFIPIPNPDEPEPKGK
jgi:hypothetical protein